MEDYIGDGVYVKKGGYSDDPIWLYANDPYNPTDKICLERDTMQSLIRVAVKSYGKEIIPADLQY